MLWKETALVQLVGLARLPMVFFVGPRVLELDDAGCVVEIPLGYRTRNHLGCLYIAALTVGADLAGGLNAMDAIRRHHPRVSLVFKEFRAGYLRRCEGNTVFRSRAGAAIRAAVARADETGERVPLSVDITATVPSKLGDEPVARFTMGLSLRRRG